MRLSGRSLGAVSIEQLEAFLAPTPDSDSERRFDTPLERQSFDHWLAAAPCCGALDRELSDRALTLSIRRKASANANGEASIHSYRVDRSRIEANPRWRREVARMLRKARKQALEDSGRRRPPWRAPTTDTMLGMERHMRERDRHLLEASRLERQRSQAIAAMRDARSRGRWDY